MNKLFSIACAVLALAGCATRQDPADSIVLKDVGSFHVGGKEVLISGKPVKEVQFVAGPAKVDPNGTYEVGQMYAQYFLLARPRGKYPLLMWHGGGLTGVTWETTPDGREGWMNYFLRQGWSVFNSDAFERGRAGWAMYPDIITTDPVFLTKANPFERFRIGDGPGSYNRDPARMKVLPGNQFPIEGYDNFTMQNVPRWTSTDRPTIDAYLALVDRVCPCVILSHSQSGPYAYQVAQMRPDKVKALVQAEPAGIGDMAKAATLKNTPTLSIYGDYISQDPRWARARENNLRFQEAIRRAGGTAEVIDLPAIGIKGNSHMMMMDRNNQQIAALIQHWLEKQGLVN